MSVFTGERGLRQEYKELSAASLAATTLGDKSTGALLTTALHSWRWVYLDNCTDAELSFYLVNPESPSKDGDYRLFWFNLGADRVINFSATNAPAWEIPGKTRVYVVKNEASVTTGKLRLTAWG